MPNSFPIYPELRIQPGDEVFIPVPDPIAPDEGYVPPAMVIELRPGSGELDPEQQYHFISQQLRGSNPPVLIDQFHCDLLIAVDDGATADDRIYLDELRYDFLALDNPTRAPVSADKLKLKDPATVYRVALVAEGSVPLLLIQSPLDDLAWEAP